MTSSRETESAATDSALANARQVTWPDWRHTRLTPKHLALYRSDHRKVLVNAGRAFGKDHILFLRGMRLMFTLFAARKADPGWHRLGPVVHLGVAAPVSQNFGDLWRRFRDLLPDIPGPSRDGTPNIHVREKDCEVELFGKNQILVSFGSAFRGDNVRGGGFDILLVTEAAYLNEMTLTQAFMPLVFRPNYTGWAMLNSTPRGPGHWWDRAIRDSRNGNGYWGDFELHEGTYLDNPCTTPTDLADFEAERRQNIYKFRQERLAWIGVDAPTDDLLSDEEGRAWKPDQIDRCILRPDAGASREMPRTVRPVWIGVDLATTGPDHLGVVVVDSNGVVVDIERHAKTGMEEVVSIMERLHEYWKPQRLSFDAHGPIGKRLEGRLARINANPVVYNRGKAEMVKHLTQHMVQGTLRIPDPHAYTMTGKFRAANYAKLLEELRSYRRYELRRERLKNANVAAEIYETFGKPPGGSDDLVDALALALHPRSVPRGDTSSAITEGRRLLAI